MTWLRLGVVVLTAHATLFSQEKQQKADPQYQEPPEEDVGSKPKEYTFNPLQAEKDLKIGNYYFKKGSYKAAMHRFEESLKWNPGFAEAALRLAEAREKLKDKAGAKDAYQKYLELEPDGKDASMVKKKLGQK